jgi:hypothetical protein
VAHKKASGLPLPGLSVESGAAVAELANATKSSAQSNHEYIGARQLHSPSFGGRCALVQSRDASSHERQLRTVVLRRIVVVERREHTIQSLKRGGDEGPEKGGSSLNGRLLQCESCS